MQQISIKIQILKYIRENTDQNRLVSYKDICRDISGTSVPYIATALNRLNKADLVFQSGKRRDYRYGVTTKGLKILKIHDDKEDLSKLTYLLESIANSEYLP